MITLSTLHRNLLEPHPANRKHFDAARLAELHDDIAARGVIDNLVVRRIAGRDGRDGQPTHQILSGERRWRASEGTVAGEALPCKVVECSDLAALELVAVPNIQREDLHPLDEATIFEQMLAEPLPWMKPGAARPGDGGGYTLEQIADRVHKKPPYVRARLRLLGLTPAARHAFLDDAFGIGSALQIARLNTQHQEEVVQALRHDADKGAPWTAETISATVQSRYMLRLAGAPFDLRDAELVPAAGACAACPKRSGTNPELFDDIAEGDTCTDRQCYWFKCEAHVTRAVQAARAAGHTVIRDMEAERLLPKADGTVTGYLRLDRPSDFALSAKPLAEVLGDDVRDVALIVRHFGGNAPPALVQVMPTAIVRQALQAKGLLREDAPPPEPRPKKPVTKSVPDTPAVKESLTAGAAPASAEESSADGAGDGLPADFRVFSKHDLARGAPSAYRQKLAITTATDNAERRLASHRIAGFLRGDAAYGFPAEGLNTLLVRLLLNNLSYDETAECARLAGLDGSPLASGLSCSNDVVWALEDEQAARLALIILAFDGEGLDDNEPKPFALVAETLGVAIDDLRQRAKDLVNDRARIELLSAAAPAKATQKAPAKVAAKYRDPETGDTWSGRGLQPRWVKARLEQGRSIAEFDLSQQGEAQ